MEPPISDELLEQGGGGGYEGIDDENEVEELDPLEQQFNNLQQEWSSFKLSYRPKTCSSDHEHSTIVNEDYFLLSKSPRELMSSLQRNEERWNAVQGRRLFDEESDICVDDQQDICSDCFNLVHESEDASLFSYGSDDHDKEEELGSDCCSFSGSSRSEEEKEVIEETTKACAGYQKVWMTIVAWFVVPLVMHLFEIISRKYNGGYVDRAKVIDLVPT